jgi:hypothetical protein
VSLPSPSASGLSRSGHAWDHNGGIDTGSSSSSSQEQHHQQQRVAESSSMQPLEDGISPHVSRSASSSSLVNTAGSAAAAAAAAGGFGQAASILSARSPRGQPGVSGSGGSFTRGSSGAGSGSVEADMQKRCVRATDAVAWWRL